MRKLLVKSQVFEYMYARVSVNGAVFIFGKVLQNIIAIPYHAAENYFAKIVRKHDLYIIENERETQFIPSLLHIDNRLIDQDTGEILSEEEMREFDGDIYEPHDIDEPETATKQSNPNEIFALFGNKVEVR